MCGGVEEMYHLGTCYPLYFHFVKHCIYLLLFVFLSSGLYAINENLAAISSDQESAYPAIVTTSALPTLMFGNIQNQAYINLAVIFLILIWF